MPEGPRKSRAQRKMDALTDRQRKLDADIVAARTALMQENEREKERRGAEAFVAYVRHLDRHRLDLLKGIILTESEDDKIQSGLVRDWLSDLAVTPPIQSAPSFSDKEEISATGVSSDGDTAAGPVQQPAASDAPLRQKTNVEDTQNLPTETALAKQPASTDGQADTVSTSPILLESAVGHNAPVGNADEPALTRENAVELEKQTQPDDEANSGIAPLDATPDPSVGKQPTVTDASAPAGAASPGNSSGLLPDIKDRQWHGDYLIEVWQKGGCQVIGMEVFGSVQEAVEQLDWLTQGASSGDESARNMLAAARNAAMNCEPKPPRATAA